MAILYEVVPIDAAIEQLNWAIRLFVGQKAYIPSITLAGAADEITGKLLKSQHSHLQPAHTQIKKVLEAAGIGAEKEIGIFMNDARNYLKHFEAGKPKKFELETEAIQMILRTNANLAALGRYPTAETERFHQWLVDFRPQLLLAAQWALE